ncbi:hypothetical protein J1N35_036077 [Gossypium stocksii]|uniref:Uncharacterized protein n=1 Tax=Gossypium stocksii TaxID=47602 RepID=A0A9D3ZS42_9ROSI|nr:hypothetical protein J1N35_036077 [Gossypium stocksii]
MPAKTDAQVTTPRHRYHNTKERSKKKYWNKTVCCVATPIYVATCEVIVGPSDVQCVDFDAPSHLTGAKLERLFLSDELAEACIVRTEKAVEGGDNEEEDIDADMDGADQNN